jgi:chitin synthase
MVVSWMVANAILAMSVSEAYQGTTVSDNWYLKFLLWSVAAIALFRAIGSTIFRIMELVGKIIDGKAKWESGSYGRGGSSRGGSTVISGRGRSGGFWTKIGTERMKEKFSDITNGFGSGK